MCEACVHMFIYVLQVYELHEWNMCITYVFTDVLQVYELHM